VEHAPQHLPLPGRAPAAGRARAERRRGAPVARGGRFTVADIIVGFAVNWARAIGWTPGLGNCLAYNARLLAMPNCPYPKD
jgi:glutathione S-transferase